MPEGADLLAVGRMVMEMDPVAAEHGFERKSFAVKDNGSVQTVTVVVFRDLVSQQTTMDLNGQSE